MTSSEFVETIRAVKIDSVNKEILTYLAETKHIPKSLVLEDQWFVSLTIRSKSLFLDGDIVEQYFWVCSFEVVDKELVLGKEIISGALNMYEATRRTNTQETKNTKIKEDQMSRPKMTTAYILYMVDRYGSRTREVLMDYGRAPKEIQKAFKEVVEEGYLETGSNAKKPYLTPEGRNHMHEYYGTDFNGYDE